MALEKMYKGIAFSPIATLTANISATDTVIPVSDVNAFPDGPNIATIGTDSEAETIIYGIKTSDSLSGCTRGVEGTAKEWAIGEIISRNFTAKDHEDIIKNIEDLNQSKLSTTDVVNTNDISTSGKALDATQNNPNISGTLAQMISGNAKKIDVLKNSARLKTYLELEELGADVTTPILYIAKSMPDASKACIPIKASDTSIYPDLQGVLMITKINEWRTVCEFRGQWNGKVWIGDLISASNTWNGWYEIATVSQMQAMIDAISS